MKEAVELGMAEVGKIKANYEKYVGEPIPE